MVWGLGEASHASTAAVKVTSNILLNISLTDLKSILLLHTNMIPISKIKEKRQ